MNKITEAIRLFPLGGILRVPSCRVFFSPGLWRDRSTCYSSLVVKTPHRIQSAFAPAHDCALLRENFIATACLPRITASNAARSTSSVGATR